jgi:hypothetical protein
MLPYHTPIGGGLYIIKLSDHHYYGGRTKCFRVRWARHHKLLLERNHFNAYVQAVFDKYGRFEPEVYAFLPVGLHRDAEQKWLDEHFGKIGCLNLSKSSDGVHVGYSHTEATKAKHRRKKHTLPSKEKCRIAASRPRPNYKPHPHTDISRSRLSISLKSAWAREKALGIKRKGFSGKHSEASKVLMSLAKQGKPHPHKGHPKTESQKEHQSLKMLAYWADPNNRQAHSDRFKGRPPTKGMSGRKHSEETKRKMSAARKALRESLNDGSVT